MIRLVIADDQHILRSGLVALLSLESDIEVVAQAADCADTIAVVTEHTPDVLLLDVQMPPGTMPAGAISGRSESEGRLLGGSSVPEDGIGVAQHLNRTVPQPPRIIVLTTFGRAGYLRRTMEAGAHGFMVKDSPVDRLVDAIRRVHQGLKVVDPELAAQSLAVGPSPLTAKESEVLRAAARGETTAGIARSLFLSEGTVRNHISAAIGKLQVDTRADAVRVATDNGWL